MLSHFNQPKSGRIGWPQRLVLASPRARTVFSEGTALDGQRRQLSQVLALQSSTLGATSLWRTSLIFAPQAGGALLQLDVRRHSCGARRTPGSARHNRWSREQKPRRTFELSYPTADRRSHIGQPGSAAPAGGTGWLRRSTQSQQGYCPSGGRYSRLVQSRPAFHRARCRRD